MATDYEPEEVSGYSNPDQSYENIEDDEEDDNGLTGTDRSKIIKQATKRAKSCHAYWDDKYDEMKKDWEFYDGTGNKQWSTEAINARKGRPILTINQLPKFVARIVAETKKNPPAVKLAPREEGDKLKADLGMGVVRYVEDNSGAKYAYSHGLTCAAIGGLGWVKVTYDESKIMVKKVKDAFSWFVDPDSEESDGSDAKFYISHKRKKDGKKIVECYEYWWKEDDKVYWAIIEGSEIEDYGEFPSSIIPIFPVYGIDLQYGDERTVKGIIRDLRDPQQTYNYIKSQEVQIVAMSPMPLSWFEEGTLEGYEKEVKRAGYNIAYYKTKNLENEKASPPNLTNANNPAIGWTPQIVAGAQNDMREVSGIYDTALGATSQETSGKAILAKQATADAGQYTFTENLQATLQQIGKCIISLIKPIMGDKGVVRILGEDGKQSTVDLNVPMVDPITGQPTTIDFDFDDMDISVSSGPAYATRREAGAQAMQDIMTAIPASAPYIADIAMRNLDVPGAEEAANRLKKMLPPELQDQQEGQAGMVPQAIVDQITQQSEATIQEHQKVVDDLTNKIFSLQTEMQNQTQITLADTQMKINADMAKTQLMEEGKNQRLIIELNSKANINNTNLANENQQHMIDIQAKAEADNKKIASDVIKAQNQQPLPPPAPQSVTINKTDVHNVPQTELTSPNFQLESPLPNATNYPII